MRKTSILKKVAILLLIVIAMGTLCSCSATKDVVSQDKVILSTRSAEVAKAFENSAYDIEIKETQIIEGLGVLKLYEYSYTIDIYDKADPQNLCAHYKIEEMFFTEQILYDIWTYHEKSSYRSDEETVLATMLQGVLDEMAITVVLSSINENKDLELASDATIQLALDFQKSTIETTKNFFEDYGESLLPDGWAAVGTVIDVFGNFPMPDGISQNIQSFIINGFTVADYIENTSVPGGLGTIAWFMGEGSVEKLGLAEEMVWSVIDDQDVNKHKNELGKKTDAFATYIIDLCNESD